MRTIPKICHLCWTKDSPLSLLQVITVQSFHRYNPDWEIVVHLTKQTPKEFARNTYVPDYIGKDYFYMVQKLDYVKIDVVDLVKEGIVLDKYPSMISDLLRVKYLYEVGGVYSDFDMIWLRPMSEFINIDCIGDPADFESTVCYYNWVKGHHNMSNMVSEPGGEYLLSIMKAQKEVQPPYGHQACGTDLFNRLYPTYNTIFARFPRVLAIRYNTFYPYSTYNLWQLYKDDDLTPIKQAQVMGVHWFNANDLSQEYIKNEFRTKCSMTSIIKREGYL